MKMKFIPILLIGIILYSSVSVFGEDPLSSYKAVYGWKQLDYKFQSNQTRQRQLTTKEFIPENNIITGLKVKGSRIFLTVPRWREGVPSTLNYVDYNPESPSAEITHEIPNGPLLMPYPSWEMNQLGNCNALQYVHSMEIDQFGRMWIIDVGRVNIFTSPVTKCPPKLVLIDLAKDEVVRKYEFPSIVVSPTGNFLNDLAVGCMDTPDSCFAYISDATDSKIIVYNYQENRSWFVHHASMLADPEATIIPILGSNYTFNVNIDGIALSPRDSNFDRLYYSPLSSYNLYSVRTSVLNSAVNGINLEDSEVKNHGKKSSQSDGLAVDAKGLLFYGILNSNGVSYFNTSYGMLNGTNEVLLAQNDADLQWPDTFAFDEAGYLYATTNRINNFKGNNFDFTEINFRVVRIYTGSKSYMHSGRDQITSESTISPAVLDANPVTNLDKTDDDEKNNDQSTGSNDQQYEHAKNKYETDEGKTNDGGDNNNEVQPQSDLNKADDPNAVANSSIGLDAYTGTLVFVLAVFVFHPNI